MGAGNTSHIGFWRGAAPFEFGQKVHVRLGSWVNIDLLSGCSGVAMEGSVN